MRTRKLNKFLFSTRVNEKEVIENGVKGRDVTIPHTWSIEDETQEYLGDGWYSTDVQVDEIPFKSVLMFHGVYRDCAIYLNGKKVVEHNNSGYTPFEIDVTDYIKVGKNLLVVQCNNAYSKKALPHAKDFDWACDGGIIRPIEFFEYEKNSVEHIRIESTVKEFLGNGKANAKINCNFDFSSNQNQEYSVCVKELKSEKTVFENSGFTKPNVSFDMNDVNLWDTENPFLYTLEIAVGEERQSRHFGVRKIEIRGNKVYLNNQQITLLAVEWMPGSNPDFGMAEPESELRKNLEMLKDIKCNFTRFHWQQDDFVYDWCDENGLMVQEEIPYWGCPKSATEVQLDVAREQADEMLLYHFNHPSIVCWGIGNELNGRKNRTRQYVQKMVSYFKSRDSMRLVNYVSNTAGRMEFAHRFRKTKDATVFGDICMWNEYLGTWCTEKNHDAVYQYVVNHCWGKPIVVTEFGICEPFFKGGDNRRIQIYKEKLEKYKKYDFAGWVYFSLNDYRTHVGEDGKGKYRQRIHGSVDIKGNIKPSYYFIKENNTL